MNLNFLVDNLFVALTEPRLLPVTVGLLGDWGSGKSSLMKITQQELLAEREDPEGESRYLCVQFSPWQYEDFDDVKVALMTTVLDAVGKRVGEDQRDEVSRLRRFVQGLVRWARRGGRVALAAGQTAAPVVLQVTNPELNPHVADIAKSGMTALGNEVGKLLEDPPTPPETLTSGDEDVITDAGQFRKEFTALVQTLEDVDAVVVFIDDLDRCLPETVVDTFEVIRLFLNTPKTAYVLAVNQPVVEAAIDSRYPQMRQHDGTGVGANYLEKMLQLKVGIPPLSAPEADTYVNLLLAELRLTPEQFADVLDATRIRREAGNLQVAFNLGIAGEVLGNVPQSLVDDLEWAESISEVLGGGLRGNPRQLKRFLNDLLLKHRSAKRRKIDLKMPVLAKLMALEEQHISDFQRLFDWYLAAPGPITELANAESYARADTSAEPDDSKGEAHTSELKQTSERRRTSTTLKTKPARQPTPRPQVAKDVKEWADKPHIRRWLRLDPLLGSADLGRYFTYSRDKLTLGVAVSRLPPHLQELLTKAQSESPVVRRSACDKVNALTDDDQATFAEALVEVLLRRPRSTIFLAALELAERVPSTLAMILNALMRIPPAAVPVNDAPLVLRRLPADDPQVAALLDRWQDSEATALKVAITEARKLRTQRGHR